MRLSIDVTPLAGGARTGVGQAVLHTVRALQARADLTVMPYALSWRARDQRHDLPHGTQFPPIPARILMKAWARADFPAIDRWIGAPNVIHATNYLTPPSRRPTVVTVHDCWFIRHPDHVAPDVRVYERVLRRAVARGAWIHAVSEHGAREATELLGVTADRIRVVPWGIPPVSAPTVIAPAVQRIMNDGPFVLSLGALEPRKNLVRLVDAFASINDASLVLAGPDGRDSDAVNAAIDRLPPDARSRVHRLGVVSNDVASGLLANAAVLAYPSLDEGFGFPLLEAMRVDTPVVAAASGAIPEVAGDAAVLVDPADTVALATAIREVVTDTSVRNRLIAAGRDRAALFTWERTADGLVALYEAAAR